MQVSQLSRASTTCLARLASRFTTANPLPPGPARSDPNLGNLGDMASCGSLHEYLNELHAAHGPVASFYWGPSQVVSAGNAAALRDVRTLVDRPVSLFALFEPLLGSKSLQYSNGDDFRWRQRSYLRPSFSNSALKSMHPVFQDVADDALRLWGEAADQQRSVPVRSQMLDLSMKAIAATALGTDLGDDAKVTKIRQAYDTCWSEMELRMDGSEPGSERIQRFETSLNFMHTTTQAMAAAAKARVASIGNDPTKCESFLDHLVAAGVDDSQAADEVSTAHVIVGSQDAQAVTMLVGGFHTTGNLLTWAFIYLAQHPEVQTRLREELQQVLGSRATPEMSEVKALVYTRQVLQETLRCSVLAPWAARVSVQSHMIGGYEVPAHTPIIMALGHVLHTDSSFPEPKTFNPDRFRTENSKDRPKHAFVPFGYAGGRVCPGMVYAYQEASVILAALIQQFEVTLADPEREIRAVHGLVTTPHEEVQLTVTKRD